MISFNSSFEISNAVMLDPKISFLITVSVADDAAVNPKGTKTLLAKGLSTFYINGKPTFIKGPRKLSNLSFWPVIFLVVLFNKILLFSRELIAIINI